ncbi:hypothetical protein U9M48_036211 [Paspalum notatum var. saurae]|uniref:Reverse transcriptase zinc-binding domain-containing protein n=1 Tax=Paspalum notatum var. saurae TaxID=547442 RepID=A0AAQ3UER3_PASNO
MSNGHSQGSVASSARHWQEAEVTAAADRDRVTVLWLGVRLVVHLNWVVLVSLTSSAWAGHFVCDGCGCKKQNRINHVVTEVGDGSQTLFWADRWLLGQKLEDFAPRICPREGSRNELFLKSLQITRGLLIFRALSLWGVILEFLKLWDLLSEVTLQPRIADTHIWRFAS